MQKDVEADVDNNDNADDIVCYNFSVIMVFELITYVLAMMAKQGIVFSHIHPLSAYRSVCPHKN